jgi:hypothetical protein
MSPILRSALKLNLPDGRGVNFPPPVLPFDQYLDWLQKQHEDRVRSGNYNCERLLADPLRRPVDAPFRLD